MEGDEERMWALAEGTDESVGCDARAQLPKDGTPSSSVGAGAPADKEACEKSTRKRRRPASRASCSSSVDDTHHKDHSNDDEGSNGPHGRYWPYQGGLSAAPAASSSGGGSGGDDTTASSDKRMRSRSMGGKECSSLAKGMLMDPHTLLFVMPEYEHSYMRYREATVRWWCMSHVAYL